MKFNKTFINVVCFGLSVFVVLFIYFGSSFIKSKIMNKNSSLKINNNVNIVSENENNNSEEKVEIYEEALVMDELENDNLNEFEWYLEIPKIKLYAPIEEGTDDEILNRSVGHFEGTSVKNGNCGFAAHNRGYRVNYFARLKELEKEDIINYFVEDKLYKYKVKKISIIYETDWSMLEKGDENLITLITCVENRPEYRLCIQGVMIEE